MTTPAASGTKAYERGRTMKRVTATLPPELETQIKQAASLSGMTVSGYLQRVLTAGFPEGLPHFGMAMITADGRVSPLIDPAVPPTQEELLMAS